MVKKCLMIVACVCMAGSVAGAALVDTVQITFVGGATSSYNATNGTITWSGGASGTAISSNFNVTNFDQASVLATISNRITPASSTEARFTTMAWTLSLSDSTNSALMLDVFGTSKVGANWTETIAGPDSLIGSGLVTVTGFNISINGITAWSGGINDTAALQSSTSFPSGTGPVDFSSNYSTNNSTIILSADETVIPEPATLVLLGLGGLGLIRRRKA